MDDYDIFNYIKNNLRIEFERRPGFNELKVNLLLTDPKGNLHKIDSDKVDIGDSD